MTCYTTLVAGLAGSLVAASASSGAASLPIRTVAVSGDVAPGTVASFTDFGVPRLNGHGEVAFSAYVTGEVGTSGMWTEGFNGLGGLELLVRQGQPAPTLNNAYFGEFNPIFYSPMINDNGTIGFSAELVGGGHDGTVVMRNTGGGSEVIAATGLPAPGLGNITFSNVANLTSLNQNDEIAFGSSLAGGGVAPENDSALFSDLGGAMGPVFREGDLTPGILGGEFGSIGSSLPILTDNALFIRNFMRLGGESDWSIWSFDNGGASNIALEDTQTPILGTLYSGGMWGLIGVSANNAGQSSFPQDLTFNQSSYEGLWLDDNGTTEVAAFETGSAADGTSFWFIDGFSGKLNGAGTMLISGTLEHSGSVDGSNDSGILYRYPNGSKSFLAREGDQAPGLAPGVTFTHFHGTSTALNNNGAAVFVKGVVGPGIDDTNNVGLWGTSPINGVQLLLREGDQIEIRPNDVRTIANFTLATGSGMESGRRAAFNDNNEIALRLTFDDNENAIVVIKIPTGCRGDLNGDFFINFEDLNLVLGNWGATGTPGFLEGDADCDGDVDFDDLNIVLALWGTNCLPL